MCKPVEYKIDGGLARTFGSLGGEHDERVGVSAAHVGPVLAGRLQHQPRADVRLQDDVLALCAPRTSRTPRTPRTRRAVLCAGRRRLRAALAPLLYKIYYVLLALSAAHRLRIVTLLPPYILTDRKKV